MIEYIYMYIWYVKHMQIQMHLKTTLYNSVWQTLEVHLPVCLGLLVLSKQLRRDHTPEATQCPRLWHPHGDLPTFRQFWCGAFTSIDPGWILTKQSFVCVCACARQHRNMQSRWTVWINLCDRLRYAMIFPRGTSCDVAGKHFKRSTTQILPHWQDLPYAIMFTSKHPKPSKFRCCKKILNKWWWVLIPARRA